MHIPFAPSISFYPMLLFPSHHMFSILSSSSMFSRDRVSPVTRFLRDLHFFPSVHLSLVGRI